MQDKLLLLHEFLNEITHIESEEELTRISEGYLKKLDVSSDDVIYKLWDDTRSLCSELMLLKASGAAARSKKLASLTDEEKAMLAEVEKVINENRFDYHFQPIVNASDGSVYSYEALMRPKSDMELRPSHVLKYAGLVGRLNDIERATFLNVLERIDNDKEAFRGRRVFINSIPKTKLDTEEFRRVGELMMKHSDTVVVELTENAEFDDHELLLLQERYRNMDIKIALDDYGTGYSNVQKLLRYDPNYVKIDRMLVSEIQNSPEKRHFVREIIGFCHDNGILALAEGIETSEELRTVILLGVDLIQGFYTARPSAEIIDTIPNDIRKEIMFRQQERQEGRDQQVYAAENTERVILNKLVRDDYKRILVGKDGAENGEVTIIGKPTLDTGLHIEIAPNYKGKLILENVHLSNIKNRPCIDLGENSDVTLVLYGENILDKNGIRVPESARLTMAGEGNLTVDLTAMEYFGIGNDIQSKHGELIFDQSGNLTINAHGKTGVCIGSGFGGAITLSRGKYILNINGELGIGLGSLYADCKIDIYNCDFNADVSLLRGAAIGSIGNSAEINISKASAKLYLSGEELAAIGTVGGTNADVLISEANVIININAYRCTCVGALDEVTNLGVQRASVRATANGQKALHFGGFSGDTKINLYHSDTVVKLKSEVDKEKYITSGNIEADGGKTKIILNGYHVDLEEDPD